MTGEIDQLSRRALTAVVGHDVSGVVGRQSISALMHGTAYPENIIDYPLSAGQSWRVNAVGGRIGNQKAASNKSFFSRSSYRARGDITDISVIFDNWFWGFGQTPAIEYANTGDVDFTAAIEYPAGTYTPLRVQGGVRWTVPNFQSVASDVLLIAIPDGALFWVRTWALSTSGTNILSDTAQSSGDGEGLAISTSAVTDYTLTAPANPAVTTPPGAAGYRPTVIGRSASKAVVLYGDSIQRGGIVQTSISATTNCVNLGGSGDSLVSWLKAARKRLNIAALAMNAVSNYGINDFLSGQTDAQVKANWIAVWGQMKAGLPVGGRLFQTTITPVSSSTDSWATTVNQTTSAVANAARVLCNNWLRDGAPIVNGAAVAIGTSGALRAGDSDHPLYGVIEVADQVESARDSGLWKVDGTANKWTADGTHPTAYGYGQVTISTASFV